MSRTAPARRADDAPTVAGAVAPGRPGQLAPLVVWAATMAVVLGAVVVPLAADAPAGLDGYVMWREVVLLAIADTSLGALIVRRWPRHPVGWLLLGGGVLSALQLAAGEHAAAFAAGRPVAALATMQLQFLSVVTVILLFQLFPTGRVLSPRWRPMLWSTGVGAGMVCVAMGLGPGPLDVGTPGLVVDNPLGVDGAGPALRTVGSVGNVLLVVGLAGALVSLGLRLRRADGIERQQLKFLVYAATVSVVVLLAANVFLGEQMEATLGSVVWGAAGASVSAAVTIAITRHRLYEIDRIISRTVTYAVVTAVLVAVYALVALAPTTVLGLESDTQVAAATLAAAGLFVPVRRRVQALVDRRFDRARYDAQQVIERFGSRMRDEVDLDAVLGDLHRVVGTTMRPAFVSVWRPRMVPSRRPPGWPPGP